ncbi:DUF503 domain-containing protein [Desulfurobacterium atlanticum]|uniref:DUF503 domain-containing protein n=1 Tax=Desulfurobacterium atlanticum TaxID=240169 RepID=A0A238XR27_9BACT|nr:DUF503 domain-containing protein [Desulfurobacterium atlanticum]SNR61435.1 hypothetical protein SAMN06265340_101198 [Desulfurobacterium atlanticum]
MSVSIGYLEIKLYIPYSHSLKEKRMVVKRLKERLKNKFNVAVSEIAEHDMWQTGVLGIVTIATDSRKADETLEKVVGFIERISPGIIESYHKELL